MLKLYVLLHIVYFINGLTIPRRIGAKRGAGWKKVEIAGNPRAVLAAENAAIEL